MGRRVVFAVLLLSFAAAALYFLSRENRQLRRETRFMMGTQVTLTFRAPPLDAERIAREAFEKAEMVDRDMGRRPGSELTALNQAGGGTPGPELRKVIDSSLRWALASGGAFDPTVAELIDLWAVEKGPHPPPSQEQTAKALSRTGHEKVRPSPDGKSFDFGGTRLDLGAIAKGHAVNLVAESLRSNGVKDFLVDAGGDIFVSGSKGGKPWKVGLADPRDPGALIMVFNPEEGAVVTSGDYERYFEWEGVRYGHVLDPKTGRPATGVASVTVWAANANDADAMATSLMVLGPEKGLRLIAEHPPAEALLIDCEGKIHKSPGFGRVMPRDVEER